MDLALGCWKTRMSFVALVVVVVVCLHLPSLASAQRPSTGTRRTQQQAGSNVVDLDGDGVPDDLSQSAASAATGGGSIRITSSKQKSKLKTVYIDETDLNVPPNQLVREQHHVYIESEEEKSEWSTVIPLPSRAPAPRPNPSPVVPPVQGRWMEFNGSMWIMVDMSKLPEDFLRRNDQFESFNITFTTNRADQLIWFTGNERENVYLSLKNGILYLTVTHNGREDQTMRIQSDQRLDDNRVHQVSVIRQDRRMTVSVDGRSTVHTVKYLPYDADLIGRDNAVYLGGNIDTSRLTQNFVSNNFVGTVRKAVISGDTLPRDLDILGLALVKPTPVYIVINGQPDDEIIVEPATTTMTTRATTRAPVSTMRTTTTRRPPITSPTTTTPKPITGRRGETAVTFDSGRNYIKLPAIWPSKFNGTVDFSFRTLDSDGLLMLTSPRPGRRDFFALELVDGTLVALYNFGSERTQKFILGTGVNDGNPHRVRVERLGRHLVLTLDNEEQEERIDPEIIDISLDLGNHLFVGGTDNMATIPWAVTSRRRDRFYRGCLSDIRFDDGPEVELMRSDRQTVAGIQASCVPAELGRCSSGPGGPRFCQQNGICLERWDGPVCDCSRTAFTGPQCQTDAPLLALHGGASSTLTKVNIRPRAVTHTNDISVQFRTAKKDGVIFATSNAGNDGNIKAYLEDGHVVVDVHVPDGDRDVRLLAQCDYPVNDNEWHFLYIKRRAGDVEAYVDNCRPVDGFLPGEGFTLDIDQIVIGKVDENEPPATSFVGNVRNFVIDNHRPFDRYRSDDLVDPTTTTTARPTTTTRRRPVPPVQPTEPEDGTIIPEDPVTFPPNFNAYIRITADRVRNIDDQRVRFLFRTNERQGLLAYSAVQNEDWYLAVELRDGVPRVDYDDGRSPEGPRVVVAPARVYVSDGDWHEFVICSAGPGTNKIMIKFDGVDIGVRIDVTSSLLYETLYVGGLPEGRPDRITKREVGDNTRRGFVGCISVLIVNGRRYDLTEIAARSNIIKPGCTLSTPVVHCGEHRCKHRGVCVEQLNGYICDCNLTSWAGDYCDSEAEGFLFSENLGPGIVIYTFPSPRFTDTDKVAFGLMTRQLNGTLLRLDSGIVDFIEFKLENGYLVVQYDLGNSEQRLIESRIKLNDGLYHYVTYLRNRSSVTLQVDDLPIRRKAHDPAAMMFNHLAAVKIGGKYNRNDEIESHFDGIIAGVYVSDDVSQDRVIDKHVFERSRNVIIEGDVRVADHLFTLPVRRFTLKPTVEPEVPDNIEEPEPEPVPTDPGRGHVDVGGEENVPPPVPGPGVDPSGSGRVIEGDGPGEKAPLLGAGVVSFGSGGSGLDPTGTRAAAVAGAMLGILALLTSLVWALYQFKPGLIPLAGFGGTGSGSKAMTISAPQEATMHLLSAENTAAASSGFAGSSGGGQTAVTVIRGSGAGAAGAGNGTSANFAQHFSAISSSSSAVGGGRGYGGGPPDAPVEEDVLIASAPTLRTSPPRSPSPEPFVADSAASANALYATPGAGSGAGFGSGTMHRGIQTEFVDGGLAVGTTSRGVSVGAVGGSSSSYIESTVVRNVYSSQQASAGSGYDASASSAVSGGYSTGLDTSSRYGQTMNGDAMVTSSSYAYEQRSAVGSGGTLQGNGYIPSSPTGSAMDSSMFGASAGMFQMRNLAVGSTAAANLMTTAEQIRVDCVQMTNNGRYVVTGSIYGPPQVWDLKTGDLVNMMAGEELSSTDVHLANGDTLLVGQVAEVEQVDSADIAAANRLHYRKLQIWDFETGRPMEMRKNESCTASCMMTDGERMVLARTERFSTGITVIIWDVLGNEPIRYLKYDSATGIADHVCYVGVSRDNRYVVTGYQNSYDGRANFVIFDLTDHDVAGPKVLVLTAIVDVTAILDNHEAVTGTLAGELVVWSLRTGKVLRQLVAAGSSSAHDREVKAIAVSKDVSLLVSASADSTLKIWNIENDKLQTTLTGHKDEVWCCAISNDNELVVSGSRDHTIRLWRISDGTAVAAIDAGVDIFKVLVSNNKKTVVALADRFAARKLIMLQIVRTKTKSISSSRSTIVKQQVVA